ncbi:MAG TPA: HD domain-containing phosphohydrolase [Acidobacteriaceae bacterium]|jgi:putative nucleotidyltransferase with HDIG domain
MAAARILVVDDEAQTRSVVAAMLEEPEYSTVLATSGREAVQRIERDPPYDVVLFQSIARGVDTLSFVERLRNIHPDTPVIVISGAPTSTIAISAIHNGAYDCLLRPFEREQLLNSVKRAVEYRRLVQQNAIYRQNLEQLVTARTEILNQAVADLERSYDITLEALGDALDLKDAETEGHSKRVTAFTIALARGMGLPIEQIRIIARGAFLHDIGKMAIPDAILLKPGDLKSDEQRIMREHCSRGYQMLRKIPFLQEAADIVYSHQEHYDGSGYPRGLKGDQIPLGARIFSIADTLDAITSDRPYRKARSFNAARGEIKRCSGTQFDPQVVDVYLTLPDQLWEDLRGEITHHAKRFSPFALAGSKLRSTFG